MKKTLTLLALILVTVAGPAYASFIVPGIGQCGGGTCPDGATFRDNKVIGCANDTSCYCIGLLNDLQSDYLTCVPCTADADCISGYGCIKGDCKLCKACSNCADADTWKDVGTGYQRLNHCNCDGTCTAKYRCAKNYFGKPNNSTSGCSRCWEAVGAVTKAAGSENATDCYIPKNTGFSDSTGNGNYTADCYYTN